MITDKQIANLLPHTAPMLMITELVNYSSDAIHCRCTLAADNPLLQDERLPALAGLELLAQGAGLLLGLNRTEGKPGGAVAALACQRYFRFETVLPCHYGSFPIIDKTAAKFVAGMDGTGVSVKTPKPGESLEL